MNTLSYKTISANKETVKKEWVVIDATDMVVGRLCSIVAKILRRFRLLMCFYFRADSIILFALSMRSCVGGSTPLRG